MWVPVMNLIYNSPICCDEDNAVRISVVADDIERQLQQEKRTPGALQGGQLLTYNQGRLNNSQSPGIEAPHQNRN
ncbi:hypothetical protein AVEN_21856-1 [Araneus ventricosus]|uniref:Uncharacterized protein n=1 Tax=Araneus ventricosus TaxID=182803 RepID=A0A4Y2KZ18_ARAVE|nr:hypothetical protein AVEN_21856-1 [Araneus ventricosus]